MKKVVIALMFLMLVGGVLAMSEPVSVKAIAGDEVKIYAWPAGTGPLLTMKKGIADANGNFNTTFFSLNVPVRFNVFVIRDGEKIRDDDFLGHNLSEALNIDCSDGECKVVEEVVVEVVNDTVAVNESVVGNETGIVSPTGNAIFTNEDGSIRWIYSLGGGIVILFLVVFIALMFRHKKKGKAVESDDDEELRNVESKARDMADRIKKIKDGHEKRDNLVRAKAKLAAEEAELKRLEGGDSFEDVRQD